MPPLKDGAEMTPVPTTVAEMVTSSMGCQVRMYNNDELLVEPVIQMLPFQDLAIPSSYWRLA